MGYDTRFSGTLRFTRKLSGPELEWLEQVLEAGHYQESDDEAEEAVERMVQSQRRPDGPTFYMGPDMADTRAKSRGFIIREGLDPHNARDLVITDDNLGLRYASEKSYNMVEAVNFIIANARTKIPDFGLKGQLEAFTEFEPHHWYLSVGQDGWAHQVPIEPSYPTPNNQREREIWQEGHEQGWNDALTEFTRQRDVLVNQHSTPDGVHLSVGVGLLGRKPTVNLHVCDGEYDVYGFLPPKMAWKLAADLIGKIGAANVKIQFDFYHVQIVGGDLIKRFEKFLPVIGHTQIAAVPTRAEPDEGEVNYAALFAAMERLGYAGWIGCEYKPRTRTAEGLGWAKRYGVVPKGQKGGN